MLDVQERDEVQPLCPHCARALRTVWYRKLKGVFGKRYLLLFGLSQSAGHLSSQGILDGVGHACKRVHRLQRVSVC
jgi:hypothetical protein